MEAEASPVTLCSLVVRINPAICVTHTVLLLPLHQRSSVHTQTDTTHLISSTPLSPICLCLFLCSSFSCSRKHCSCDRHRQTHQQLSTHAQCGHTCTCSALLARTAVRPNLFFMFPFCVLSLPFTPAHVSSSSPTSYSALLRLLPLLSLPFSVPSLRLFLLSCSLRVLCAASGN